MGKYIFKVHFLKTFNDGEVQVSQWHHQIPVLVRDSEEDVKKLRESGLFPYLD